MYKGHFFSFCFSTMVSIDQIQVLQERLGNAKDRLVELVKIAELDMVHRDALVQRFEFTFELYRKTLKKILIYEGIDMSEWWVRTVLRKWEKHGYVDRLEIMIDFLDMRNTFSHEYSEMKIDAMVEDIQDLHVYLLEHIQKVLSYTPN